MLGDGESLGIGENIKESVTESIREAHGTFLMIIQGILLQTGEGRPCHPVVIQIEQIFVRTILPCGLHLKAQESHPVNWISLIELAKDSEKALLSLIDFVVTGPLKEGGIL